MFNLLHFFPHEDFGKQKNYGLADNLDHGNLDLKKKDKKRTTILTQGILTKLGCF